MNESPIGKIFDFSDFLSPMLVKELRQGLRGASFASLFMAMQALLSISILLTLIAGEAASPGAVSVVIFNIYVITVCGIQPLRGCNAISAEIKNDTIDLVLLTRLSSWKIVFGKWVSLMAQSMIFAVSLLPYIILRYFLGDMQLFAELLVFALIFIIGGIVTAISIGGSAITSIVLRFIIIGGIVGTILIWTVAVVTALFGSSQEITYVFGSLDIWSEVSLILLGFIVSGGYLAWLALDFGASAIAPISENRSTLRRILFLCLLLLALAINGYTAISATSESYLIASIFTTLISFSLFIPFFVTTFSEQPFITPSVAMRLKQNKLLKPVRYLLYPGWGTGWLFMIPCAVILLAISLLVFVTDQQVSSGIDDDIDKFYLVLTSIVSGLALPAALLTLFKRDTPNRLTMYLILLIGTFVLSLVVMFLGEGVNKDIIDIFCWLPAVAGFQTVSYRFDNEEIYILVQLISLAVYTTIILVRASPYFAHIKEQERLAVLSHNKTQTQKSSES